MRCFLSLLFSLVILATYAGNKIKVVDDKDSSPVAYATVFGNSGVIVGLTDDNGIINVSSTKDFPLTVKCLGYEPAQCDVSDGEVRLKYSLLTLQEVVVTPVDRPVLHLVCYVREYVSGTTGTDTLMNYNEHMADFFLPTRKKIKGFKPQTSPRFLRSRLYSRISDSNGLDSIFKPKYRDDSFSWEGLVSFTSGVISESEKIANGAKVDSVPGKHGTKELLRKNGDATYIVQTDYLADSKNHKISPFIFKMLGLTIDFTELQGSWVYKANDERKYTAADIVSGTFSLSVLGKGKWIKKAFKSDAPVQMYSFYEIYPVDAEYLTVEESKEMQEENLPKIKWTVSPNATPLAPAIQRMVDACKKKQKK